MTPTTRSRFFVLAALAAIALNPRAAQAQARSADLPIPLPPRAVVQMEIDGRDHDLLGMIKDLIGGVHFGPQAAVEPATAAGTAAVVSKAEAPALLSDGDLAALLQNIHHLHLVSFAPPAPIGKTAPAFDGLAFYQKPFQAQGGHRTLFYGNGPRVALYGFDQPRGFGAIVDNGGVVYALRADGYPNLAVLGRILHVNLGGASAPATVPATPATPPI